MKSTQTVNELLTRIRQCLEEAGIETSEEVSEHEALVAGRFASEDEAPVQIVIHISDENRAAIKFGSLTARSVAVPAADIMRRPSLEGRSAAGAPRTSEPDRTLEGDDLPTLLEKLGDLRESGVLTAEEFKAAKKRLLHST